MTKVNTQLKERENVNVPTKEAYRKEIENEILEGILHVNSQTCTFINKK